MVSGMKHECSISKMVTQSGQLEVGYTDMQSMTSLGTIEHILHMLPATSHKLPLPRMHHHDVYLQENVETQHSTYPSTADFLLQFLFAGVDAVYICPEPRLEPSPAAAPPHSVGRCTRDSLYSAITVTPSISLDASLALDADLMSINATLALGLVRSVRGSNLTVCTLPYLKKNRTRHSKLHWRFCN